MKQHEREYFVSRLRSGIYYITKNNTSIKILTPTLEDEFYVNQEYVETYNDALRENIMTEEELLEWKRYKGLWTEDDDNKITGLEKDIERLKVEIFNARHKEDLKERIRTYIRAGETQLKDQNKKKSENYENTCESIATTKKTLSLLKRGTFIGGTLFDFKAITLQEVWGLYYASILSETKTRELARTDPWHSLWVLRDSDTINLFANKDRELSIEQKSILIWSRMYDNIQESMDCPSEDVISDDDLLDGWFIVQKKKQEKERAEAELEQSLSNSKIASADEVFVMAGSNKDADRINSMNDLNSEMIKKERMAVLKNQGSAKDLDFRDQKLKLQRMSNEQFKGKFGR